MLNYFHICAILQKKGCENMLTLYKNIKIRREEYEENGIETIKVSFEQPVEGGFDHAANL